MLAAVLLQISLCSSVRAGRLAELDAVASSRPGADAALHVERVSSALGRLGAAASFDQRLGLPTFLWAKPSGSDRVVPSRAAARPAARDAEQTARGHLGRLALHYRLGRDDVRVARLRLVRDLGGGTLAAFRQVVDGVEVFRDEIRVLMDRDLDLVAISGYLPAATLGAPASRRFTLGPEQAVTLALADFGAASAAVQSLGPAPGGYERFTAGGALQPVRVKKVLFHLPGELRAAYYLELMDDADAYSYVISAGDGGILYRHDLVATDSFGYRVWADTSPIAAPLDGPQGSAPTPHPTGLPDSTNAPFVAPALVTLQNGPISSSDPWLPPGATQTVGNNVDAYVDLFSPDGLSAGDFRASVTAPGVFDRAYDTALPPAASADQRQAAITQLFYTNNFLHDWFYDAGFDEVAGNAQASNYGRGGVEGDRLRAESQDFIGTNNANMATPADGAPPRMQMFVFRALPAGRLTVNAPPAVAGVYPVGTAIFTPGSFDVTAEVVLANDGVPPTSDGCEALPGSVAGKIVFVDRGSCNFVNKVLNAQSAGAVGVIIADNVPGEPPLSMGGSPMVAIAALSVTYEVGNLIRAQLGGAVSATLYQVPQTARDGTLDNQIVAHEWGHYISNRLVGNANGLTTQQSLALGEGWGDFHALLLTVRPEDAQAPGNSDFSGTYSLAGYSLSGSVAPNTSYYFGLRRYPYSTNLAKNPLTFRHIQDGVPLPSGPPVGFGANGAFNSEVHNTGEVWAAMLWECYAALLRDTGRLSFQEASRRMRSYLVAAYQMTPHQPTFTEARDALLAVAFAGDPADFAAFCQGFAKRGAGTGAQSPDRYSITNAGVVESFACGGALAFVGATLDDQPTSCDQDGTLDDGETGRLTVTLRNTGATTLSSTTATITSDHPAVRFPSGNIVTFAASTPFSTRSAVVPVSLEGALGIQALDLHIDYGDPGLLESGSRSAAVSAYANTDETPSRFETVEASVAAWTMTGNPVDSTDAWRRVPAGPAEHRFFGPNPAGVSDQVLVTPPLHVPSSGNFVFQFAHSFSFERDLVVFYDGGVLELSADGGGSWVDIGSFASPGYGGTLFGGARNPLANRAAFVGRNARYPDLEPVTVNLGTGWAGQTVQVRFRLGADEAVPDSGWQIDNLIFFNLTNLPFQILEPDPGPCDPLAVGEIPASWSLVLDGAHPVARSASFRFDLPEAARVDLSIYDVSGRRVATLAHGERAAGRHRAAWDAGGDGARRAGVYFARLTANQRQFTRRIVVTP